MQTSKNNEPADMQNQNADQTSTEYEDSARLLEIASYSLEVLLGKLDNEINCVENKVGDIFFIEKIDVMRQLRDIYELAVSYNGECDDLINLAGIEQDIAKILEDNEQSIAHYRHAVECYKKIGKDDQDFDYKCDYLTCLDALRICLDSDGVEYKNVLTEQYNLAKEIENKGQSEELDTSILQPLGQTFVEYAEIMPSELIVQCELYSKGIRYLQKVADIDKKAGDFYNLGDAQGLYLDHCFDLVQKIELRESAISNLKHSYELEKNPKTLERLYEIEES